jgi:hypothetical protein
MRLPRLRFSVRLLMAIVAVLAATLGGFVEYHRLKRIAAEYRAKAEDHAGVEKTLRAIIEQTGPNSPVDISPGPGLRSRRFTAKTVADFEAALSRKYERAARYPWLSVEPDPVMAE